MNDDTQVREAARERLFDAALVDAVAAERAGPADARSGAARTGRVARVLQAALLLLGICVTVAVLVLRDRGEAAAQDPDPFDPVFPRVENEWLWGPPGVEFHTQQQLDALPEHGPEFAHACSQAAADRLARQPGVRILALATSEGPDAETWSRIARMGELEVLHLGAQVTPAQLRELRHAPRLRTVTFNVRMIFDEGLAASLVELPHLSCVMFVRTEIRAEALARLRGLPHLQALYFESCEVGPSWLTELGSLHTLRWLAIHAKSERADPPFELSADDLRQIGALPKLAFLRLSNTSVRPADLHLLPTAAQVLSLQLSESLTASGVRDLTGRKDLRGLLLVRLEPEAEQELCASLPRMQLERFGTNVPFTASLWRALEKAQTLRRLAISTQRTAADIECCARLGTLEQLDLTVRGFPGAYDLSPLRRLQRLRRVVIFHAGPGAGPSAADVDAMRSDLGAEVELFIRP